MRRARRGARAWPGLALIALLCTPVALASEDEALRLAEGSILGVRVGDTLESARAKLEGLGTRGGQEGKGGTYKEAWSLSGSPLQSLAYKADKKGRIVWLTGWLRRGQELPFENIGGSAKATAMSEREAHWSFNGPAGDYRVVAKGGAKRASVVYVLLLEPRPIR